MRLSTAITAATAAAVTLAAIAAPGAGAMVSSGGGGTPYSGTTTTHSHSLVSGATEQTGQFGERTRAHCRLSRLPACGPCISPYRVVIDGSGSKAAPGRRPPRSRRFSGVTPGSAQGPSCSCSASAVAQWSRPGANVTASRPADGDHQNRRRPGIRESIRAVSQSGCDHSEPRVSLDDARSGL